MPYIDELSDLVRHTAATVGASVVTIGTRGRGTGFVVAPGKVLTNAHNLRDRTTAVGFADGRTVQAAVSGADLDGDLVVLDVDTVDVAPLAWAAEPPGVGDVVLAITAGRHRRRTTWGQVTATETGFTGPRGRAITGALEHTAACAPGSSGAPIVDRSGHVVGVNTHRVDYGFYLARTVDAALLQAVADMADGRTREPAHLGVAVAGSHIASRLRSAVGLGEREGLLVREVQNGSPAAAADIRTGDLIVKASGVDLRGPDDLFAVLGRLGEGDQLTLDLVRGTDELTVVVTL